MGCTFHLTFASFRLQTTIMAVTFDGGVVLGADSRTSTGSYVANRVSDKIVPIHDYVWACRSGSAADTQAVSDYVKYYINSHRYLIYERAYENRDSLRAHCSARNWVGCLV
jgi:20S proteasome alpha/beta subunit